MANLSSVTTHVAIYEPDPQPITPQAVYTARREMMRVLQYPAAVVRCGWREYNDMRLAIFQSEDAFSVQECDEGFRWRGLLFVGDTRLAPGTWRVETETTMNHDFLAEVK